MSLGKNITGAITGLLLYLFSNQAGATLITFDDLVFTPSSGCCDQPLTNEYAALGLLISGGFLNPGGLVTGGNLLLGSPSLSLSFLDPLPTVVSMYVSALNKDMVILTAYGLGGFTEVFKTEGWGGPFHDTPYAPDQFVSFFSPGGISNISIEGFYGLRVDAQVDNIFFSTTTALSSPGPISLVSLGLLLLISMKQWQRKTSPLLN